MGWMVGQKEVTIPRFIQIRLWWLPLSQGDSLTCEHAPYLAIEPAGACEPQKPSAPKHRPKCEAVGKPPVETEGLACGLPEGELWEEGGMSEPIPKPPPKGNRLTPNKRRREVPVSESATTRGCKNPPPSCTIFGKTKISRGMERKPFPSPPKFPLFPGDKKASSYLGG
jgi:hypothetical protein